ncbi:MAG: amidophosphoribosyltransferase [Armatimonadota bacterium]
MSHEQTQPGRERLWRDACGVFGVYNPEGDVSRQSYFGLYLLQHRGQESAGIAVSDGREVHVKKGMGLANAVFSEDDLRRLQGQAAIGHVRYSTTGSTRLENAQPILGQFAGGTFALGHNGNLVNARALRDELEAKGWQLETTTDTELIAALISESGKRDIEAAVVWAMQKCQGAYSLVILTKDQVLGVRDPYGVRPLCIGRLSNGRYVLASETCALSVLPAAFVREVEPGEVVVIDERGLRETQAVPLVRKACCIFEFIYFARPDSYIYGQSLYMARKRMGHVLAREQPAQADLVIPVPDSGAPHAVGFAEASRLPFSDGLIKNRYILRTFIQPEQQQRHLGVRMKFTPLREAMAGRRVVLVEDSIVRGTTCSHLVGLVRDGGAKEVHLRIASPPIRYPCFYGIDMDNQDQFIAWQRTVPQIADEIGADSLGYLSTEGLIEAVGLPRNSFCMACFNNRYPIPIPKDIKVEKMALEVGPTTG